MNSTEPVIGQLHPLNDCVLVELQQSHKNFTTKETKYESRTEGIVIKAPDAKFLEPTYEKLGIAPRQIEGKRIHFEEFKEGARIKRGTKIYSFIKIEDIRGYED